MVPATSEEELTSRLLDQLRTEITATTGLDRYNILTEQITGARATEAIKPTLWKSAKSLFHLRNMLAHGRAIKYDIVSPAGTGGVFGVDFSGGYKLIETYLMQNDLIKGTHFAEGDDWFYFSNDVADHFWKVACEFTAELSTAVHVPERSN